MKNEVAGSPCLNSMLFGRRLTTLAGASRTSSTSALNPENTGMCEAIARSVGAGAVMFWSLEDFLQARVLDPSPLRCPAAAPCIESVDFSTRKRASASRFLEMRYAGGCWLHWRLHAQQLTSPAAKDLERAQTLAGFCRRRLPTA